MKKTSKILSLLVALCMAVTVLSGLTVFAADPFELVSYDADADFVTLDFNQAIDLENSQFVVKHGDEYLTAADYTIAKADANSSVQADGVSSRYTYQLTFTEDIILNDEYTVSFWDVKSADGVSTLAQSALRFSVAELATDADLVDIVPYKWGNSNTWVRDEETGGMMIAEFNHTSNNMSYWSVVGARVGEDTTEEHILPNRSLPAGSANWTETDYTVKATIKASNMLRGTVNFGIASDAQNMHGENATGAKFVGIKTYDYTAMTTTSHDAGYYLMANSNNRSDSASRVAYFARTSAPNYNPEAGFEFKVSSKDGVVRAFMNGKKLMDGEVEVLPGYPFVSVYVSSETADTKSKVQVYDFQVTQSLFEEIAVVAPEGYRPPEPDEEPAPVEVLDWNADLDFFTVDFEEEIVSMDATITQSGEMVVGGAYNAALSTADPANMDRCTWIVKPNDGFAANIPYTVTIANAKDAEGNVVLANWSKTFMVEIIDQGITYPSDPATKANHYAKGGTVSQLPNGGIKFQNAGDAGNKNMLAYAIGEDTDATKAIGSAGSAPNAVYTQEAQYTVKATYKIGGTSAAKIGLGHRYSINPSYGYDHNWSRGTGVYVDVWPNSSVDEETGKLEAGNTGAVTMYSTKYIDSAVVKNMKKQDTGSANQHLTNLTPQSGITLKLAMKNDNTNVYINGGKAMDNINYGERGCLDLYFACTSSNKTGAYIEDAWCEITDIVITKATHLDVTGEAFTSSEATVEEGAIAGNETVTLSTVVTNNTLNDKAIFAACAFYNAAGAMTNLVISEVEEALTGETTIEFEDAETLGATFAKIFIWDGADTLNAWFPAIEVQ